MFLMLTYKFRRRHFNLRPRSPLLLAHIADIEELHVDAIILNVNNIRLSTLSVAITCRILALDIINMRQRRIKTGKLIE